MDWIEELEKAMGRRPADEDEDGYDAGAETGDDGDEDEDEEEPTPPKKVKKGTVCPAKPNAETTNSGGEPSVHDPKSLDKRSGGGPAPIRKSVSEEVSDETQNAMDVSPVLTDLAKSIDALAGARNEEVAGLGKRVETLEKGLAAVGKGIAAVLGQQANLAKSIQAEADALAVHPRQRKSQVRVVDKSFDANKGTVDVPSRALLCDKSMAALKAGKIDAQIAAGIESAYNRGEWSKIAPIWEKIKD